MRIAYRSILKLVIIFLVCTTQYYGQTADLQFVVTQNDQTVNGTYAVKLQIKLSAAANMGTSSLQFTYNTNGLNFPASPIENTDYVYSSFQGLISISPIILYSSTVTRPILGKVSINIVLSAGSAAGQTITTTYMDIATIKFTILDANLSSNLQWVPETTTIFDDQNNPFTNGTLNNVSTPLPVELATFSASNVNDAVNLKWQTATEVNNYGFDIERKSETGAWSKIGFVAGNGNSNSTKNYSYVDNDPIGGSKLLYRLKQVDNDGKFEYSDAVEVEVVPTQYELSQNYPNPFNPSTSIKFSLPKQTQLKLNLYNMLGQLVETIAEGIYEAGYHKVTFNASSLPSGVYIYRIESSGSSAGSGQDFTRVRKMVLIK